jgi:hypothetical protein
VHGIGDQPPGSVVGALAAALLGEADAPADGTPETPVELDLELAGRTAVLREANWSAQSHPDNPPVLRDARGLVPEFYRAIATAVSRAARPWAPADTPFHLMDAAWVAVLALWVWALFQPDGPIDELLVETAGTGLVLYGWWGLSRAGTLARLTREPYLRPVAWALRLGWSILRLLAQIPLVFLLLALGVLALLIVPYYLVVSLPLAAIRWLGRLLEKARLRGLARWLHRLTWAMVVFPIQSHWQTAKAMLNLVSILLIDRSFFNRLRAALWLPLIVGALLTVSVPSGWVWAGPVLAYRSAIGDRSSELGFWLLAVLLTALYLVALRLLLPVLDFLLDVANYHLAPARDRAALHEPLEEAHAALRARGCRRIHLLCHSLGTVLAFDWLKRSSDDTHRIESLLTLGSPLNKFWYLDHPARRREDPTGLSRHVARRWVNFWALTDPVSGALRQFHSPELQVENRLLPLLLPFPWSHTAYWHDPRVLETLRDELR